MFAKIGAAVLGALLVLGLGASAGANTTDYTGGGTGSSVSSSTVVSGGTVTFGVTGFAANRAVTVTVTRTALGAGGSGTSFFAVRAAVVSTRSVMTDANGAASVAITLGDTGVYTITASGFAPDGTARTQTQTVNVPVASASGTKAVSVAAAPAAAAPAAVTTRGVLARTGVDNVATMAWVAFGVLVLGGVLVNVATGRGRVRENA